MRRVTGKGGSKRMRAQAAMVASFAQLYASRGNDYDLPDVIESYKEHGGPTGLTEREFYDALCGFVDSVRPVKLVQNGQVTGRKVLIQNGKAATRETQRPEDLKQRNNELPQGRQPEKETSPENEVTHG